MPLAVRPRPLNAPFAQTAEMDAPSSSKAEAFRLVSRGRAWAMVLLLTLLTVTSFVDRYAMTLLVADMHRDIGLTDVQFGILVGPAFILSYAIVLFPIATLVDLWNRQVLIAVGVVLWSAMTIASAWASSFGQLAGLRTGLAIGEAVLAPAAISLVGDLFAPADRRLPMIIVVAGSQVGIAAASLVGAGAMQLILTYGRLAPGWLPQTTWRLIMIAVGVLPLLVGVMYFLVAREPARGGHDGARATSAAGDRRSVREHIRVAWPLYGLTGLLTSLVMLIGLSLPIWAPTFLIRRFGVAPAMAGYALGPAFLISSLAGVFVFPVLVRFLSRRRPPTRAMVTIAAGALVISPPLVLLGCFGPSFLVSVLAFGLALFVCATVYPLPTQIVQLQTPAAARARVGAAMLLIMFLVSSGLGPVLVPEVARWVAAQSNSLGLAIVLVAFAVAGCGLATFAGLRRWLSKAEARLSL